MKLKTVRIQNYRSIRDTGTFEIEPEKTIMVGPNEAGKTVLLQALQQVNAPKGIKGFDVLRDYPRALYTDISTGKIDPADVPVVTAAFALDDDDRALMLNGWEECDYEVTRNLDNSFSHRFLNAPACASLSDVKANFLRLAAHVDKRHDGEDADKPGNKLSAIVQDWVSTNAITSERAKPLTAWLNEVIPLIDESNTNEENRRKELEAILAVPAQCMVALAAIEERLPVFVYCSNYFRVRPILHLEHLAQRLEGGLLDDDQYDYGNACLLKLLGFTAHELSNLGKVAEPDKDNPDAFETYRDQLDKRDYQLDAASVRLTREVRSLWNPHPKRSEADTLEIKADGQYLKVVVVDDLGVKVELDQRSEGFQWLVSFFVVFFAEVADEHDNAILLLDEPGMSLHALKQRDFRTTISRLAENNQTVYTTHSPFLVGPEELDLVRVVEMTDREDGTKVHTAVTSSDPAALLPLQEALGYDLAQSLFAQQRNLICEGLTDYWYVEAVSKLFADAQIATLNKKIALVPANTAGKVVYFATILHAHNLKVVALLDSDTAGDQAAQQDVLVRKLGNKHILRTKDYITTDIKAAEIEDLLRETLVRIAKEELGSDVAQIVAKQPKRSIVSIFESEVKDFSKYKLAKAFLRWSRDHDANALSTDERQQWSDLIDAINKALR